MAMAPCSMHVFFHMSCMLPPLTAPASRSVCTVSFSLVSQTMIVASREYRAVEPTPELTWACRGEKRQEYVQMMKDKPQYQFVMSRLPLKRSSSDDSTHPRTPRTCGMLPKRIFEREAREWRLSLQSWSDYFLSQPLGSSMSQDTDS